MPLRRPSRRPRPSRHRGTALALALASIGPGLARAQEAAPRGGASPPPPAESSAAEPASPSAPTVVVESLSGSITRSLAGGWEIADRGGKRLLRIGDAEVPLDEVLFLKLSNAPRESSGIEVVLDGGDRLRGAVARGDGDGLDLLNPALGSEPLRISLDPVRALVVPGAFADGAALEDFRAKRLSGASLADRLFLRSGEPIEGILDSIEKTGIRFGSETLGELLYPYDKLRGIELARFDSAAGDPPAGGSEAASLTAVVQMADQSSLSGRLEGLDGETFRLDHPILGPLRIDAPAVVQVSFRGGRCVFLSDIEPSATREHLGALLVLELPHRRDRSVLGAPMRMGGRHFAKGLGVHAYSLIEYELGGKYRRFQATLGLDESARPDPGAPPETGGAVVFRVRVDGETAFEAALAHDDAPRPVEIPLDGARVLALEVDFGDDEFVLTRDRANWGDARIIR